MMGSELRTGNILVVDDDMINRKILARSLKKEGHTVQTAQDGLQALDMLRSGGFDAVLLDMLMPGMDGAEVLATIKGDANLRHLPVIMVSAQDELDSIIKCIEMGAEDYLPKPFNATLLHARLTASLERKQLRDLEVAYLQQEATLRESERMAAIGRLSAGVAHELNNPAAAVQRSARQLGEVEARVEAALLALAGSGISGEQMGWLTAQGVALSAGASPAGSGGGMRVTDRAAEIEEWLAGQGIADAWEIAPGLAALGYTEDDLARLPDIFSHGQLSAVLTWLANAHEVHELLGEIGQGAGRMTTIVQALKDFTYMDRAPVQLVDVHASLESTLALLGRRLEAITIRRDYTPDLPRIQAYGADLSQVWMHLLDNAAYALEERTGGSTPGEIVIRTRREGECVVVVIVDNGPGIPAEIANRIFDPFVTTRPPGSGAGLGLTTSRHIVVDKHGGSLTASSQPGETCLTVRLPIEPSPQSLSGST